MHERDLYVLGDELAGRQLAPGVHHAGEAVTLVEGDELAVHVRAPVPARPHPADQRALGRGWQELADELGGTDVALRKKLTRALDRVMVNLGLGDDCDA